MMLRSLTSAVVAFAAFSPSLFAQTEKTPTALVRIRSLDTLLENVRTVVGLVGQEELGRQFEGLIRAKVGEQGLEGIDLKRPIGAYLFFGKELEDVGVVVMVPIANEKAFLTLIENLSFKARMDNDGVHTINAGVGVPISFRFANQYAYFTAINVDSIAKNKLQDPGKVFVKITADVSATIRIEQLPEAAKLLMLASVEDELNKLRDKKEPNETAAQRTFRHEALKEIGKLFSTVLEDGAEITYAADLSREKGEFSARYSLTGKPGSKLAQLIANLGSAKSLFANVKSSDSTISGLVHLVFPPDIRKSFEAVVDETTAKALASLNDPAKRKQAELLIQSLAPSLKAGELDAGFALTGPGPNKHYTMVAGVKIKEGDKLAKTMRDLLEQSLNDLPPQLREMVKLDADSAGPVKIHRFDVGVTFDAKTAAVFGHSPLYIALRNDAAFVSVGEDGLNAIKNAVASPAGVGPPVAVEVAVARLAPLMGKALDDAGANTKAFAKDDGRIRVSIEGGQALTAQVSAKLSVLQFFGGIAGKQLKISLP